MLLVAIWPIQNDAKPLKMTETMAHGYSFESTQQKLSNEYKHDRVWMFFLKSLRSCVLDESSLSIGRVKPSVPGVSYLCCIDSTIFGGADWLFLPI